MGAVDSMRKAFDDCTVMAGVENDFECVYIVKSAALAILREIDDENTKLRNVLNGCAILLTDHQFLHWPELREATLEDMRELGIEVDR